VAVVRLAVVRFAAVLAVPARFVAAVVAVASVDAS